MDACAEGLEANRLGLRMIAERFEPAMLHHPGHSDTPTSPRPAGAEETPSYKFLGSACHPCPNRGFCLKGARPKSWGSGGRP